MTIIRIIIISTCWPRGRSSCCACAATCPARPPGSPHHQTLASPGDGGGDDGDGDGDGENRIMVMMLLKMTV